MRAGQPERAHTRRQVIELYHWRHKTGLAEDQGRVAGVVSFFVADGERMRGAADKQISPAILIYVVGPNRIPRALQIIFAIDRRDIESLRRRGGQVDGCAREAR